MIEQGSPGDNSRLCWHSVGRVTSRIPIYSRRKIQTIPGLFRFPSLIASSAPGSHFLSAECTRLQYRVWIPNTHARIQKPTFHFPPQALFMNVYPTSMPCINNMAAFDIALKINVYCTIKSRLDWFMSFAIFPTFDSLTFNAYRCNASNGAIH